MSEVAGQIIQWLERLNSVAERAGRADAQLLFSLEHDKRALRVRVAAAGLLHSVTISRQALEQAIPDLLALHMERAKVQLGMRLSGLSRMEDEGAKRVVEELLDE